MNSYVCIDDWLGSKRFGLWVVERPCGCREVLRPFSVERRLRVALYRLQRGGRIDEVSFVLVSPLFAIHAYLAGVLNESHFREAYRISSVATGRLRELGLSGMGGRLIIPVVKIGRFTTRFVVAQEECEVALCGTQYPFLLMSSEYGVAVRS